MTNHSKIFLFLWRRKAIVVGVVVLLLVHLTAIWIWSTFFSLPKSDASSQESWNRDKSPTDSLTHDTLKFANYKHYAELYSKRKISKEFEVLLQQQMEYENELKRLGIPTVPGVGPHFGTLPPAQRIVHLDLKGAPPKTSYIKRILPMLKTLGATGLLLEYEDMFPYRGMLASVPARNAYKRDELTHLLETIYAYNFTVIPLVQTFGHLEFVLKLREYSQYRETDAPQALCPAKYDKLNNSANFIDEMVSQVVEFHNSVGGRGRTFHNLSLIHIGCDEVFQMGECDLCRGKLRDQIFLDHVTNVAGRIKQRWPGLKIIIWDDMLRHIGVQELTNSGLGSLVEPMIWVYTEDIVKFMMPQTWDKYSLVFRGAWAASAFKGAHGETLILPPTRRHLENTLRWLTIMHTEGSRFQEGMRGLVLTGWQRYDHFAVLCELLPAAIPTLAICLSAATRGYFELNYKSNPVLSALTCSEPTSHHYSWIDLQKDASLSSFSRCMYPGNAVFRLLNRLAVVTSEAKEFMDGVKLKRGWLTDYNVRHNYTSAMRIDELLEDLGRLQTTLTNLAKTTVESMHEVYDQYTIGEYMEQRVYPHLKDLQQLGETANKLRTKKTWPQRPLPYLKELDELGISLRSKEALNI